MKIKITQPISVANSKNLTIDSEHNTVPCPAEYQRYKSDVWVQGEKEPVRLFPREYVVTDSSEPDHPAYQVKVSVIDMNSLSEEINKQLQKSEEFKGKDYEIKENLAIIKCANGKFILTDKEACFFDDIDTPFNIDVYRKSIEKIDENGNKGRSIFMFPTCQCQFIHADFKRHQIKETNLAEFMADRFQYNPRISENLTFLMEHINK